MSVKLIRSLRKVGYRQQPWIFPLSYFSSEQNNEQNSETLSFRGWRGWNLGHMWLCSGLSPTSVFRGFLEMFRELYEAARDQNKVKCMQASVLNLVLCCQVPNLWFLFDGKGRGAWDRSLIVKTSYPLQMQKCTFSYTKNGRNRVEKVEKIVWFIEKTTKSPYTLWNGSCFQKGWLAFLPTIIDTVPEKNILPSLEIRYPLWEEDRPKLKGQLCACLIFLKSMRLLIPQTCSVSAKSGLIIYCLFVFPVYLLFPHMLVDLEWVTWDAHMIRTTTVYP